jgi:hypothetical protein
LWQTFLTRFRRTSDGEVIPGPEHGFDIVGGYFSADLKSSLSHFIKHAFSYNTVFNGFFEDKSNVVYYYYFKKS